MEVSNFWIHLIIALTLVQLVLSGDNIIEDVDREDIENLDGVSVVKSQSEKKPPTHVKSPLDEAEPELPLLRL